MEALRRKAMNGELPTYKNDRGERVVQAPYDPWKDEIVSTKASSTGGGAAAATQAPKKAGDGADKRRKSGSGAGRKKGRARG